MGFFDEWGAKRRTAAYEFLATGKVGTAFGGTACFGSNTCATGYACINGRCQKVEGPGGGSGGTQDSIGGEVPEPCAGGPDGVGTEGTGGCATSSGNNSGVIGCTVPTCGADDDCCGPRCCRFSYGSGSIIVSCYCGACPEDTSGGAQRCNTFCHNYFQTHGEDFAGCQEARCSECSDCTGSDDFGNYCEKKAADVPCHCDPGSVGPCDECTADGTIVTGQCYECCESIKDCSCGKRVAAKVCVPPNQSGPSVCNLAQIEADRTCETECAPGKVVNNPCNPVCESKTICQPGSCPDLPPNTGGKVNIWTGCIESGGQGCLLYDECDYTDVPDSCNERECYSSKDCANCQVCNADKKCVPDPECEGNQVSYWQLTTPSYTVYGSIPTTCPGSSACLPGTGTTYSSNTYNYSFGPAPAPHRLVELAPCRLSQYIQPGNCSFPTYCDALVNSVNQRGQWDVVDANGNKIGEILGNYPAGWGGGAHPNSTSPGCVTPVVVKYAKP